MNEVTSSQSWSALIEECRPTVFALCYRLVGSVEDAEDLTQETFVRVIESVERFEGRSSFKTWTCRIATNVCYTFLQSAQKRRESVLPDPFATSDEFLQSVTADGDAEDVRRSMEFSFIRVLQELPPLQRTVVVLRDVLGWSVQEAAEALGSDAAAVKNVHSRARKHLNAWKPGGRALAPSHPNAERLMETFAEKQIKADVDGCVALYRTDAEVYVFPSQKLTGKPAIRAFHQQMREVPPRLFVGVRLNGNLGAACYHPTPDGKLARTGVVLIEAIRELWRPEARIGRAYWVMQPDHLSTVPTPTGMEPPAGVAFLL